MGRARGEPDRRRGTDRWIKEALCEPLSSSPLAIEMTPNFHAVADLAWSGVCNRFSFLDDDTDIWQYDLWGSRSGWRITSGDRLR